jgi:hypothetical protein
MANGIWDEAYRDVGDVRFGALWVDEQDGTYARVLEVIEISDEDAPEDTWTVLIESGTVGLYSPRQSENVQRLRRAVEGIGVKEYLSIKDRAARRVTAWAEMASYGPTDIDESEILYTTSEDAVWDYLATKYGVER